MSLSCASGGPLAQGQRCFLAEPVSPEPFPSPERTVPVATLPKPLRLAPRALEPLPLSFVDLSLFFFFLQISLHESSSLTPALLGQGQGQGQMPLASSCRPTHPLPQIMNLTAHGFNLGLCFPLRLWHGAGHRTCTQLMPSDSMKEPRVSIWRRI